jgi:glutathione synthase/RimK-type ligase-like ATP-grasp enzyme
MKVGIHKNIKGSIQPFSKGYIDILTHNNITVQIMDIANKEFWQQFAELDAFIFQVGQSSDMLQISGSFMPILQHFSQTPIFPNFQSLWHFDDKVKQHYLACFYNLDFVKSWVFWDEQQALCWAGECEYPIVFKLKGGAGSSNVIMVRGKHEMNAIIRRAFRAGIKNGSLGKTRKVSSLTLKKSILKSMGSVRRMLTGADRSIYWRLNKNYVYVQKFLPYNGFDTRVTVIGDKAFAYRRFNRKGDFRASGSGKNYYDSNSIDLDMVRIALDTSQKCGFQSMAYDFLYEENIPRICEISYTYVDKYIYNCPGYWDYDLIWHSGHYMPQLFILQDLLKLPLKQPDLIGSDKDV